MKAYHLDTKAGFEAFAAEYGMDLARATRFGMAYGMSARKQREKVRDAVVSAARISVSNYFHTTAMRAIMNDRAVKGGIVFG